jgi:hypothetical protein
VEKIFLKEFMNSITGIDTEFNIAPLQMVDPIAACVLNIKVNIVLHHTTFDFTCKGPRKSKIAHILV